MTEVVPYLQAEIDLQTEQFDDVSRLRAQREALSRSAGVAVRQRTDDPADRLARADLVGPRVVGVERRGDPMEHKTMRAALRDHQRLLDAIRDGNASRAVRLAQDHLAAARRNTLAVGADKTIEAKLISRSIGTMTAQPTTASCSTSMRDKRIATITLNNPKQRNSYDAAMRESVARYLDQVAEDDDITVVLLRGADGVFSTGADMNNAYGWYGESAARRDDAQEEQAQPASPAHRRPQVVRLLPQPDGLPEGHRRRDQRLRARRRLRDGADDRHLRHRAATPRSACPPPASSGPRWAACTCSSTASVRCWPVGCC